LQADGAARKQALEGLPERIRAADGSIRSWVEVAPQPQRGDGPLAGIPFGIKDVIETEGLSTEYGSPLYQGRRGNADAALVRRLRDLGAVVMGKTETAAFAYRTPALTRNPRNLGHTPGGSSSGSAAAVAAGMIPFAIGTQTLGSVVRPASFCGVTGFKPSFGWFPTDGVLTMSRSLDTLGFFTETPQDMQLLWDALGLSGGSEPTRTFGVPEPLPAVEPAMAEAFKAAVTALQKRGLAVEALPITPMLERLAEETRLVMFFEGSRSHEQRFRDYGDRLLDLADLVREGLQIPETRYQEALAFITEAKRRIAECFAATPVILVPAATGPAPKGLGSTGDPRVNAPWTALGTPALSVPMPVNGLPLGLQVTAAHGEDARVLRSAVQIADLF
jgi:Asp-tRNA(Asn)/Glu-tRNA(Gln) amidotransferase A subunit family amidase